MSRPRAHAEHAVAWQWTAFAGWTAFVVGLGLARFAYAPLFPALVAAGWFSPSQAAYIGAANLIGYLAGAWLAGKLRTSIRPNVILPAVMAAITLSFFAGAVPLSFAWFFFWRFVSGVSGAALVVIAAPTVLTRVPPARAGMVGGIMFGGLGIGVVASSTIIPALMRAGLSVTWIGLGCAALVLTIAAWPGWPRHNIAASGAAAESRPSVTRKRPGLLLLYVAYGLSAVACVPHTIFLVDLISRDLGRGEGAGALYWLLFGLSAGLGPIVLGRVADTLRFGFTVTLAFLIQGVSVAAVALDIDMISLAVATIVAGAFNASLPLLVLGRIREVIGHDASAQKSAWSIATLSFALGQAAGAYGLAALFTVLGGDRLLFAVGGSAALLAFAIDLASTAVRRPALGRFADRSPSILANGVEDVASSSTQ